MENLKSNTYEEIRPHKRQVKIRDINTRLNEQNLGINVTDRVLAKNTEIWWWKLFCHFADKHNKKELYNICKIIIKHT